MKRQRHNMWHSVPIRNPGAKGGEMFLRALYASSPEKPSLMLPSPTFPQCPTSHSTSQEIYLSASGHSVTSLLVGLGQAFYQEVKGRRTGAPGRWLKEEEEERESLSPLPAYGGFTRSQRTTRAHIQVLHPVIHSLDLPHSSFAPVSPSASQGISPFFQFGNTDSPSGKLSSHFYGGELSTLPLGTPCSVP